jgi:uncharacterized membrane protein HdeD (DUF308 family)
MVWRIVLGAISIIFGILVLVWPGISLGILVIMVGIWAIVIGILQIIASIGHRGIPSSGWVWGIIGGALAILFGIIWIIGIWAIIWGIIFIVLGFQLRKAARATEADVSPTTS